MVTAMMDTKMVIKLVLQGVLVIMDTKVTAISTRMKLKVQIVMTT